MTAPSRGWLRALALLALLALLVSGGRASTPAHQSCEAARESQVAFAVSSRRNLTGHWLTQVQLLHGQDSDDGVFNEEARPWDIHVAQSTAVCEGQEVVNITVTLSSPPRRPSPSYELFPGVGYYKFHTTPSTWSSAREVCAAEGGHLAIVNSQAEENVLKQLFAEHTSLAGVTNNDFAFLGFHDRYTEGEYVTIFGKPLSTTGFVHWGVPQPDNSGGDPGEDCGSVHRSGVLNDITCDWKLAFVCEQELW
ncbi:hemolymph lipopolysaccharide-binding protein-like [Bacillus rossius redtenbacheri]|uniref:hemolymph lipopolysaccharide-binding protein-like n=1 Tax=Bacillus rossius redtenbacheri TaxID=93214 RepID=UPI002FDE0F5A